MKIIKEDLDNLEKVIDNDNPEINAVANMPMVMADAVVDSEKKEKQVQDVLGKSELLVNVKPFLGAKKQPTPKAIKEPKVNLEESMFDAIMNTTLTEGSKGWTISEKAQDLADRITEFLQLLELPSNVNMNDFLGNDEINELMNAVEILQDTARYSSNSKVESLTESTQYTPEEEEIFWKLAKEKMSDEAYDELCKNLGKDCSLEEANEYDVEDPHDEAYYDALDVPAGPERRAAREERRREFIAIHKLNSPADVTDAQAKELAKAEREFNTDGEEDDIATRVLDELDPYDLVDLVQKNKTKFPEVKRSNRYNIKNYEINPDGNILLKNVDFDFANKVAQAYGVRTKVAKDGKSMILYIDELEGVPVDEEEVEEGLFNHRQDRIMDTVDNVVNNVGTALNTAVSNNSVINGANSSNTVDSVTNLIKNI